MATVLEKKWVDGTVSFNSEGAEGRTVCGYATTWTVDSTGDKMMPGSVKKTITERFLNQKNEGKPTKIKVLYQHNPKDLIGFPTKLEEDAHGLVFEAYITDTKLGNEILTMIKDGTLSSVSIGFGIVKSKRNTKEDIREIDEVKLYEFSFVTFPANEEAIIQGWKNEMDELVVKSALDSLFSEKLEVLDSLISEKLEKAFVAAGIEIKAWTIGGADYLPVGSNTGHWDGSAAEKRMREFCGGMDNMDWDKYRKGFIVYDSDKKEEFGGYKLPFADIVHDKMKADPRGIMAAAGAIQGARGGVDLPSALIIAAKDFLDPYFKEMGSIAPWNKAMGDMGSEDNIMIETPDGEYCSGDPATCPMGDNCPLCGEWSGASCGSTCPDCTPDQICESCDAAKKPMYFEEESMKSNEIDLVLKIDENGLKNCEKTIDNFCDMVNNLIELKLGRILSKLNESKIRDVITSLQALLDTLQVPGGMEDLAMDGMPEVDLLTPDTMEKSETPPITKENPVTLNDLHQCFRQIDWGEALSD